MKRFAVCMLLLLVSASIAFAQLPTATILGTVKDASGAIVAGATVTARGTDTGQIRTAVSEADGSYRLNALPVGNYEVRVEQAGFKASVRGGITLTVDQQAVIDFALEVGATTEQIEVTGEAPVVNTTSGTLGGLVDEQRMSDLPLNGRDYVQLALLQAGVSEDRARLPTNTTLASSGTWYSSNGAPLRSNSYLIDGTSMSTYGGGTGGSIASTTLGIDGIREFRIVTNSFDAEYGMVMGSQMLMVSKSGTNSFHGDGFEFMRNSSLDARNFFDTPATAGLTASGAQRRLPIFRRNNFGGAFGGPIRKDKDFFFATYEGVRQTQGTTALASYPPASCIAGAGVTVSPGTGAGQCPLITAAQGAVMVSAQTAPWLTLFPPPNQPGTDAATGTKNDFGWSFPTPTQEDYGQIRVDHTFSAADNLLARYTVDNANILQPVGYIRNSITQSRNQYLTLAENHVFSPSLLNTARFSYSRTTSLIGVLTYTAGPLFSLQVTPSGAYVPFGGFTPGSGITGPPAGGTATSQVTQNVFSVSDDLFYTHGKNSFKFGALFNRYQLFVVNGSGVFATISFSDWHDVLQGNFSSFTGLPGGGVNYRTVHYNTLGSYIQDDYRATSRLTLNLGFRYEFNTDVHAVSAGSQFNAALMNPQSDVNFTPTNLLSLNPSYKNWSPRVGFAWDVFGDGKTSVRGGFGVLYNIAGWLAFLHGALRAPPGQPQITVNPTSGSTQALPRVAGCVPNVPAGNVCGWTVPWDFSVSPLTTGSARNPANFDWNMKQSHMIQYNLAVQRQLPWQMAVTMAYGGSRGFDIQSLSDGNPSIPDGVPSGAPFSATPCISRAVGGVLPPFPIPYQQMNLVDGPNANSCFVSNNAARWNPNWGGYNTIADNRSSFYNSLQVVLDKHITQGLQFQTNFTWSKLIDNAQGASSAGADQVAGAVYDSDPWHPNFDRGPSNFDLPISWKTNVLYHFPKVDVSGAADKVINGWWVTSIFQLQSGNPVEPEITNNRSFMNVDGNKNADRPDLVPGRNNGNITSGVSPGCKGVAAGTPLGTPNLWYDPCAFTLEPIGFFGNSPRNFIRGPKYKVMDFSVVKDTKLGFLGEAGALQFRAEIFNILNHANFSLPNNLVFTGVSTAKAPALPSLAGDTEAPPSSAATITTTAGSSRQIQLSVKIIF